MRAARQAAREGFLERATRVVQLRPEGRGACGAPAASGLSCVLGGLLLGFAAGGSEAAEWRLVPTLSLEQAFTDNARLSRPGTEEADALTTVTPSLRLTGESGRLNVNLNAALSVIRYWDNSELDNDQQNLSYSGSAEVVRDLFFIDTRAAISEQTVDNRGPISVIDQATPEANRTSVKTYSISPYLRNRFGRFAESELRYTFSQVFSGALSDTTSNRISESLRSGDDFSRLRWVANASISEREASGQPTTNTLFGTARDSKEYLATFAPEYALNRFVTLLGMLGYEKIEDPTLANEPDGPIGNLGVRVRPGPRAVVSGLVNYRFEETYVTGEGSYLLGPETQIDVSYTRGIRTSQSLFEEQLTFLAADEEGQFIDARNESPFRLGDPSFNLSGQAFTQKRFDVRLRSTLPRDTIVLNAFHETRESDQADRGLPTQTVLGASASWLRQLTPTMDFSLDLRVTDTDFGDGGIGGGRQDQYYLGRTSLRMLLSDTFSVSFNYDVAVRESTSSASDLQENVVSVTARKTF